MRGGAHALLRNDLHREERVARSCCVRRGGICHRRRGSPGGLKGGGLFQFFTPGDVFFGGFQVYNTIIYMYISVLKFLNLAFSKWMVTLLLCIPESNSPIFIKSKL